MDFWKYKKNECPHIPCRGMALKDSNVQSSRRILHQNLRNLELYAAYCHIVATCPSRVETILKWVKIMLNLGASTAQCERVFSSMNNFKERLRCKLTQTNLQAQLFIMIAGPKLKKDFSR